MTDEQMEVALEATSAIRAADDSIAVMLEARDLLSRARSELLTAIDCADRCTQSRTIGEALAEDWGAAVVRAQEFCAAAAVVLEPLG